ncbi:MAG: putative nucleic acid-binding protein contains domain [Rhizobium sp.]|nr:putative nucleic acid-binding protein contains domain [Rhizobium sp.]
MILVIDASVAIKWFVEEDLNEEAIALSECGYELVAPDLIFAGVANVLRRRVRLGHVVEKQAAISVANLGRAFQRMVRLPTVIGEAFEKAALLDHSVYDVIYLICALRQTDGILVTADKKFEAKAVASGFGARVLSLEAAYARFASPQENDNG